MGEPNIKAITATKHARIALPFPAAFIADGVCVSLCLCVFYFLHLSYPKKEAAIRPVVEYRNLGGHHLYKQVKDYKQFLSVGPTRCWEKGVMCRIYPIGVFSFTKRLSNEKDHLEDAHMR